MKKIAVYGKGGSGKSTIAAALSVRWAMDGLRVLHVGCDPKSDSTLNLTGGPRVETLLDLLGRGLLRPSPEQFIVRGRHGIDCIEAGGPRPGAGCGGRGIARMFELFNEIRLFDQRAYDVVVFDVLGDVVCGGFAAPLRYGFADRGLVVLSEEPLSIFAANNILHALLAYRHNGVRPGGLVVNVSDSLAGLDRVNRFAAAVHADVLGVVPRDPAVQDAETRHVTAAELPADSPAARAIADLAAAVLACFAREPPVPTPLETAPLFALVGNTSPVSAAPPPPPAGGGGPSERGPEGDSRFPLPSVSSSPSPDRGRWPEASAASRGPEGDSQPSRSLPNDRTVTGSPQSCAGLAALLGLEREPLAPLMLEVAEFGSARGALTATLSGPSTGRLRLVLKPAGPEVQSFAVANDIAVSYTGALGKGASKVLDCLVKLLRRGHSFGELKNLLLSDPAAELLPTLEQRKDAIRKRVESRCRHWVNWGEESVRGRFFFEMERSRQVVSELRLADRCVNVHHGTDSCHGSEQDTTRYAIRFVRFPWPQVTLEVEPRHGGRDWYYTSLNEYHLIAGSNAALKAALDGVLTEEHGDPVYIDVSCPPVVAGEDYLGAIREFKEKYPGPVLNTAVSGTDARPQLIRHARTVLESEAAAKVQKVPRSVNLVGFPPTAARGELAELLAAAGIRVLQWQLPSLRLTRLPQYNAAEAQLLWPLAEFEPIYEELFSRAAMATAVVTTPFGPARTRRFLMEAAAALSLPFAEVEAAVSDRFAAVEAELEPLRRRASQHRIGLALTTADADLLDHPERLEGVPLREMLEALGFAVEVLQESEDEKRLDWWLRSGLSLVYSDLFHDGRLLSRGLGHFAIADLEPGLCGAVRSCTRLLSLCENRFFRNLARYTGGKQWSG